MSRFGIDTKGNDGFRLRSHRAAYEPRRPDFIDVAGGFPDLTGGAGGGVGGCSLVGSIAEGG
jgi:hypothetical protein